MSYRLSSSGAASVLYATLFGSTVSACSLESSFTLLEGGGADSGAKIASSMAPQKEARATDEVANDTPPTEVSDAAAPAAAPTNTADADVDEKSVPTGSDNSCESPAENDTVLMVDSFESEELSARVQPYTDETPGEQTVERVPGGLNGQGSLHFTSEGFTSWGSGIDLLFEEERCVMNAGQFTGIRLWLRGEGTVRLALVDLRVVPEAEGGLCPVGQSCFDSHAVSLTLNPCWTQYHLPFHLFLQKGWGYPVGLLDPEQLAYVSLINSSSDRVELWLDDVALYTEAPSPPPDPVCTDAGAP